MSNNKNREKLLKLYDLDLEELISIAEKITNENFPKKEIEVCSIISAKTGKCGENCNIVLKAFIIMRILFAIRF